MDSIRILINGAKGRMGRTSSKAVREDLELDLVAETDLDDNLVEVMVMELLYLILK